jgi:hypothetical protein
MTPRRTLALVLLAIVPTLLYVGMLLLYPSRDLLILWKRDFGVAPASVAGIVVAVIGYCTLAGLLLRRAGEGRALEGPDWRRTKWATFGLVVIGGLALQIALTTATEPDPLTGLARRTYSWATGGYWTVGAPVTDVRDFIGRYAERAPTYPVHQARHPPGLSLIFWLGTRVFELAPGLATPIAAWLRPHSCLSLVDVNAPDPMMASAMFGAVVEVVLAMLPILPLFALVQRLAGKRAALWSAVLYPLMPGFGMWVSQFDRGVALATAIALYVCERLVAERRLRFAFFAGLTLSVATFATFGAVPIALMTSVYVLVRLRTMQDGAGVRRNASLLIASALLAALGIASIWVIAFVWTGLDPVRLYRVVFDSHLGIDFPFWPFVFWHPWDVLTMVGLPLAMLTIFAGWRRAPALAAAFAATLLALSLAHVARGETGRVWLYLAPAAVGAAAIVLAGVPRPAQAAIVGALAVQLIVQGTLLRVLVDYGIVPESLPSATIPPDATVVDARFGASGQIALLAYRLDELRPGQGGTITLYWQRTSDRAIESAYKGFVHVAADEADQNRIAQHDEMPMRSQFPTTCWQQNQVVADVMPLVVSADARPGDYFVFVGLYDPLTERRPPTFASPPAQQLHGSVLLPTRARVPDHG